MFALYIILSVIFWSFGIFSAFLLIISMVPKYRRYLRESPRREAVGVIISSCCVLSGVYGFLPPWRMLHNIPTMEEGVFHMLLATKTHPYLGAVSFIVGIAGLVSLELQRREAKKQQT